jgi:hypothetical protein
MKAYKCNYKLQFDEEYNRHKEEIGIAAYRDRGLQRE